MYHKQSTLIRHTVARQLGYKLSELGQSNHQTVLARHFVVMLIYEFVPVPKTSAARLSGLMSGFPTLEQQERVLRHPRWPRLKQAVAQRMEELKVSE